MNINQSTEICNKTFILNQWFLETEGDFTLLKYWPSDWVSVRSCLSSHNVNNKSRRAVYTEETMSLNRFWNRKLCYIFCPHLILLSFYFFCLHTDDMTLACFCFCTIYCIYYWDSNFTEIFKTPTEWNNKQVN